MEPAKSLLVKMAREFFDENDLYIFDDFTFEVTEEEQLVIDQVKEILGDEPLDDAVEGIFADEDE